MYHSRSLRASRSSPIISVVDPYGEATAVPEVACVCLRGCPVAVLACPASPRLVRLLLLLLLLLLRAVI